MQGGALCDSSGCLDAACFERAVRGSLAHYTSRVLADRTASRDGSPAVFGGGVTREDCDAQLVALKIMTAAQVHAFV